MDLYEVRRVVDETNGREQEKLVEDIVKKLREIGDELDKNSKVRIELSLIMPSSIKTVLYNCVRYRVYSFASVLTFLE